MAIIGQTNSPAPADKRIYATRDITATVDSIPLITASILAKKLAEGLDALVMDVKAGSGALILTLARSEALAIIGVANGAGCRITALLTDMNQVLASSAGNALEVCEAVRLLTNDERNPLLSEVTMALCSEMLVTAGLVQNEDAARCCGRWTTVRRRNVSAEWWRRRAARRILSSVMTAICRWRRLASRSLPPARAISAPWIPAHWV